MADTVRVLGFDPGTRVAGYGVLDATHGEVPRLVTCGALVLTQRGEKRSMAERLLALHEGLEEVVLAHRPEALAVERVFYGKSFESVLKVGEARGVGLLIAARHGLDIEEYSPSLIKKTVTGNGRASKVQVQSMVARLLRLDPAPEPVDVTDALAMAFCYSQRLWRRELPGKAGSKLATALEELRARKHRGQRGQTTLERLLERRAAARDRSGADTGGPEPS